MPEYGWEPIILTVHENYYEEALDHNLEKLLAPGLRLEKVKAYPITKPRLVGDIGLRAFFQLYKRAKQLIQSEKIDFLYITIPSFYCALLGRYLHRSTKIKYGIDYIDPWVHKFPGSNHIFSRHWFSTQIARILEPIAVKHASLITGVAEGYYRGVSERNPHLLQQTVFGSMPYGGEAGDHKAVAAHIIKPYIFKKKAGKIQLIYAGTMLPKAYLVLEKIFQSIQSNLVVFNNVEFHFIGTGKIINGKLSFTIRPLAENYNLWQTIVFEYPQRISYLDVIVHLNNADGIFILGSTEPHYTPSKIYQAVLSCKPVFAVLHKQSSAVAVVNDSNAGLVLSFDGEAELAFIKSEFANAMQQFMLFLSCYDHMNINQNLFEQCSAKACTKKLSDLLQLCFH